MARAWFLMLGLCGLGCVAQVDGEPHGALSLALRQSAESGAVYRLSGATLAITGAEERTVVAEADQATLQVELSAGDYALELQPGYALQRQDGASWLEVAATLASDNPQSFAIEAGEVTALSLRFALDDDTSVELAVGALEVTLAVEESAPAAGCAPRLVLNELDYDQEGADTADFVELYNAGDCALDTAGVTLVLINGGVAGAPSYATIDLTLAGATVPAGQYVVVGRPELAASLPAGVTLVADDGFAIQNGSPDGVRVEQDGVVLDSMTYGGVIDGVTEISSAPADSVSGSLGRCPDGHDGDEGALDFGLHAAPTPGAPNGCP